MRVKWPNQKKSPEKSPLLPNLPPHRRNSRSRRTRPVSRPSRFERYVRRVISGSILADAEVQKHYPYVLFMAVLMFLYIANGFHTQKLHRQHERLTARVKELRAQSLTISSQRMIATRQSEIIRELEERGIPLDELVSPPKIIDK